jgi:hypothetical protein
MKIYVTREPTSVVGANEAVTSRVVEQARNLVSGPLVSGPVLGCETAMSVKLRSAFARR